MYNLTFDSSNGILTARIVGFMSVDEATRYSAALGEAVEDARTRSGRLSLLIDASESSLQAQDTNSQMDALKARIIRSPEDRIAVVANSSLMKLQVKRVIGAEQIGVYISESAARTWLLTYS